MDMVIERDQIIAEKRSQADLIQPAGWDGDKDQESKPMYPSDTSILKASE
jgi:hypothetical protein